MCGVQHLAAPSAMGDIEQKRARGIGDIDRMLTRQAQADVVLGKKEPTESFPQLGLVIAYPEQLGEREIRQGRIAGKFDQPIAANRGVYLLAFFRCPLVAPDQRRAQYLVVCVEQYRTVHLTRESYADDFVGRDASLFQGGGHRLATSSPPVFGALLGPASMRRSEGSVLSRGCTDHRTLLVHHDGTSAAGADINA
jgi:hypothetical protein